MNLAIKGARLTSAGINKLTRFADLSERGITAMFEDATEDIKNRIAEFAPTEELEAIQLCYPGIPRDNFMKEEAGFFYLRQAIRTEQISVNSTHGILKARFGDVDVLSPLIGFAWHHGKGREPKTVRTTLEGGEIWKTLLAYWEYGGSLVVITARDPGDTMTFYSAVFGSRVTVTEVEKQIPPHPYEMYQLGGFYAYNFLLRRTRQKLKEVISWL